MLFRNPSKLWLLNCCVSPQADMRRVRIDRSMIGSPTEFRHIGHMGANDLTASSNVDSVTTLLQSKGSYEFEIPVPDHLRSTDRPIVSTL